MRNYTSFATAALAVFIGLAADTPLRAAGTARVELGSIVSAANSPWIDTQYHATPTTRFVLDMQKLTTGNQERFFWNAPYIGELGFQHVPERQRQLGIHLL